MRQLAEAVLRTLLFLRCACRYEQYLAARSTTLTRNFNTGFRVRSALSRELSKHCWAAGQRDDGSVRRSVQPQHSAGSCCVSAAFSLTVCYVAHAQGVKWVARHEMDIEAARNLAPQFGLRPDCCCCKQPDTIKAGAEVFDTYGRHSNSMLAGVWSACLDSLLSANAISSCRGFAVENNVYKEVGQRTRVLSCNPLIEVVLRRSSTSRCRRMRATLKSAWQSFIVRHGFNISTRLPSAQSNWR